MKANLKAKERMRRKMFCGGLSTVQYQSIEVLLGDDETGKANPESTPGDPDGTVKDIGSLAHPISQNNEEKDIRNGSPSAGPPRMWSAYDFKLISTFKSFRTQGWEGKSCFIISESSFTINSKQIGFWCQTDKVDERKKIHFLVCLLVEIRRAIASFRGIFSQKIVFLKLGYSKTMVYPPGVSVVGQSSSPPPAMLQNSPKPLSRGFPGKVMPNCCLDHPIARKTEFRQVLSGVAASVILLCQTNLAVAADTKNNNLCQLASAINNLPPLPLDKGDDDASGKLMMMRGMTTKDFDPVRYAGRWFEVASLKRGFAGQGQEDCHCTQGLYTFDMTAPAIQVDTFCVHGGPDGYITGIKGKVQCLSEEDLEKQETDIEKREMIKGKCYLRFPTLPFIPKEPYDVIATDYDNFALVSGAKDKSFVQIYSRTPDPGRQFIEKYKANLENLGYDPNKIKDTPQDCQVMSNSKLAAMMSMQGMQQALTNQFPDLELKTSVEFNPFTSVFDTLKKLVQLYFNQ